MKRMLDGVRVLDLTTYVAGPTMTSMMAREGAEVVVLENPITGDITRGYPPFMADFSVSALDNLSGKRSVQMNLADPEGQAIVKEMVKDFDVLVEGFRPGTMKKFGLDYDTMRAIKPDLIYVSISAFGQTGPWADRPGFDNIAQALSGVMAGTGDPNGPPVQSGIYVGDTLGGLNALAYMAMALYNREKTGEGRYLDVSLYESAVAATIKTEIYMSTGVKMSRTGNHQSTSAPYGVYEGANNRYIAISAPSDKQWKLLTEVMGRPELATDPRFDNTPHRVANREQIIEIISTWLKTYDDINDAAEALIAVGIPAGVVREAWEVADCPQLAARGYFIDRPIPDSVKALIGKDTMKTKGQPVTVSGERPFISACEKLGQSNEEYLLKYISKEKLDELIAKWTKK
ncbi:MAG: CaiB/BaiF CoA transferase family protein [Oscillospiraceae bacterium]